MTAVQLDLLADIEADQEANDEAARRRAGDFTWASTHAGPASCVACRHTDTIPRLRIRCGIHHHAPDDRTCLHQFVTANAVRYYTARVAAGTSPREHLEDAITDAHAARAPDYCGELCPFRGCPTCQYQGGIDRPRKEE